MPLYEWMYSNHFKMLINGEETQKVNHGSFDTKNFPHWAISEVTGFRKWKRVGIYFARQGQ